MRDALSLLDQAIAFGAGNVERSAVDAMLGSIDHSHIVRFLEALASGDGSALLGQVASLDEQAPNYSVVLDNLMTALQRIAVRQLVGGDSAETDEEPFRELAGSMSPEDVQLYYQIALHGRRDLAACADWRSAFEMTLLRMLAFRPGSARDPQSASSGPSASAHGKPASQGPAPKRSARPAASPPANGSAAKRSEPSVATRPPASVTHGDDAEAWPEMLAAADVRGAARQLAEHCVIEARAEGQIKLILTSDKAHLNTDQVRSRLESSLAAYLGSRLRLTITPGRPSVPTPAEQRKANETRRMRQAREAIESDPMIKGFQSAFDAVVDADTIEPVETAKGTMQ